MKEKEEKANKWLLSKKPVGGNSCASCEAYLGELQEDKTYIPWNHYPTREFHDRDHKVYLIYLLYSWVKAIPK